MGADAVGADPDNLDTGSLQGRMHVSEPTGLLGTARGVVSGVKVQDHLFSSEFLQRDGLPC
jgi:hypothetical protein